MTPETVMTIGQRALEITMLLAAPLLLAVLAVGVVVGVAQAATQLNEPTIAFVAKAVALTAALFAMGSFLLGTLVEYTTALFQRLPHVIG